MKSASVVSGCIMAFFLAAGFAAAAPQTTCPVMGGKVTKDSPHVDVDGKRIYVCCPGCISTIEKDPQKYIDKMKSEGVMLEKVKLFVCPACGEIKGTDKCCKKEGRVECPSCGLLKGSPGCCKLPKDLKDPVVCSKCGELKGSKVCCKAEGRETCDKCGLFEGSIGCCKLPKDATKPMALCAKCGELKGTEKCCNAEGRTMCNKCGLMEGSVACCKLPKDFKKPAALCPKCSEIKGSDACCAAGKDKSASLGTVPCALVGVSSCCGG